MSIKDTILSLINLVNQQEETLVNLMTASQREQTGELDHWAAKEILVHIATWSERMVANVARLQSGEGWHRYENFLEINDHDFQDYRLHSWEQALARSRSARHDIRDLVSSLTEAELLKNSQVPPDPPRPLWQRIIGNAIEHPTFHLGMIFDEIGQSQASTPLEEEIVAGLLELNPGDNAWEGIVRYNMACRYALTGHKSDAVKWLKQALVLNPGLTEWSQQDTDLVSLHDEIDYQTLYK